MQSYAQQLRGAEKQIKQLVELEENSLARFGHLVLVAFDNAVSTLILVKREDKVAELIGRICISSVAVRRMEAEPEAERIFKAWPVRNSVPLGQYHFSGRCRSALGLAYKFAKCLYAETSNARLRTYPNQNIDGKSIEQMSDWRDCLWTELVVRHPGLADWQNWKLHKWRDEVSSQIRDEYNELFPSSKSAKVIDERDYEEEFCDEMREVPECELASYVRRRLLRFFHDWNDKPTKDCPSRFDGLFQLGKAETEFYQHLSPLILGISRCVGLAENRSVEVPALRRIREMLAVSDVKEAQNCRYDAAAELNTLQSWNPGNKKPNSPNQKTHAEHVERILESLLAHRNAAPGKATTDARDKKNRQMKRWPEAAKIALEQFEKLKAEPHSSK